MLLPKSTAALATILAILTAVAAILAYKYWYQPMDLGTQVGSERQAEKTLPDLQVSPVPSVSPSPKPIKQGNETYAVSQPANQAGPKITKVTLKPHDPKVNQSQTIEVTFNNPETITNAQVTFVSDNQSVNLPLALNNNTWSLTHAVTDTVLYRYVVTITASDQTGTSKVDITMR